MRSLTAPLLFLALTAYPAAASEPPAPRTLPEATERLGEELARAAGAMRESMGRVLLSLEEMARLLPRYEAPEINENGDIIIRRKPQPSNDRSDRDGTI